MSRERETMCFGVRECGFSFGDARAPRADDFARSVTLVLHHRDDRDVYARGRKNTLGSFFCAVPPSITIACGNGHSGCPSRRERISFNDAISSFKIRTSDVLIFFRMPRMRNVRYADLTGVPFSTTVITPMAFVPERCAVSYASMRPKGAPSGVPTQDADL